MRGDLHGDCDSKTGVCAYKLVLGDSHAGGCPAGTPSHSGKFTDNKGMGTPTEGALWNTRPSLGLGHGSWWSWTMCN